MKTISVRQIALAGVFAALVFAASHISIPIPSPVENTRIHLGNALCVLSGLLLGPFLGGCAAGIGSMFFDLLNPLYVSSAPFTLVFKFMIGFLAGAIAYSGGRQGLDQRRNLLGGLLGALCYILLYLAKSYVTARVARLMSHDAALLDVAAKALVSTINAVLANAIAIPLAFAVRRTAERGGYSLRR